MIPARYPWRIVVVAAISVLGNVYLGYNMLFGLAGDGLDLDDQSGKVVVTSIDEVSAAARSELHRGDEIVSVNAQAIKTTVDWLAQRMNFAAERPIIIRVKRGAHTVELSMVLTGTSWEQWTNSQRASGITFLTYKLVTLLIGLFVVFSRPRDFVARVGGWLLVVMAMVFQEFRLGLAADTRELPWLLAIPVLFCYVSAAFRTPLLAAFFCLYPKRLFAKRWLWAAFWAGPTVATLYALYLFARTVYDPAHLTGLTPSWVLLAFGVQSLSYLGAVLVILPLSYWRLQTQTDRRRFRVLVFGALLGIVFYLPRVIGTSLVTLSPVFYDFLDSPYVDLLCGLGTLIFPISFAYAILKQRLFDVRLIIRRGVQYALARRVLLALPILAIGVLLANVLAQGRQPLFVVLQTHAATYVAIIAMAALASTQRNRWLSALDRRFFRDKYDAQELFREIVEEIRRADNVETVAPRVVGRVAEALHTQRCGWLVRRPGDGVYHVAAAVPVGSLSTDLPVTNKLVPLVRMLERSVSITAAGSGWLGQQLPQVDKDFVQRAGIELLVPVSLNEESTEALFALGAKLSEEPYSKEDLALLENVAGAMALLLTRETATQPGRAFEECPICGSCYDTGTTRCRKEGTILTLIASPRMLIGRYRLQAKLGQGGMGKVYRATDASLNRDVAVKMIRDEFFADRRAVDKFRQESQVTGSFSHPNVVTVYDFGVDSNNRVFLVMELLDGITLRQELRSKKRLSPARTLELFAGICAGVGAAHTRGLIHRDLKPENIFLAQKDAKEIVKITDFGIAKALPQSPDETSDTITGALVGTIRYMSPEQLRGRSLSQRWDVWALAVIAYEALCGCAPFSGEDITLLQSAIVGVNFPPVTEFFPGAPAQLQSFFERAFAHLEENRVESVGVFWNELCACLRPAAQQHGSVAD